MNKIVVGLTIPALEQLITEHFKYRNAQYYLSQHKILISDSLLKNYEQYFIDEDEQSLFQQWVCEYSRIDFFEYSNSLADNLFEELVLQEKNYSSYIIVFFEDKIQQIPNMRFLSLLDLDKTDDVNNILRPYCTPYAKLMRKDDTMDEYIKWLKEWLDSETTVNVIDGFICKANNDVLKDIYIPIMPSSAKIHIYYDERHAEQSTITKIKNKYGDRVKMHSSNPDDIHDRFIICDSFYISIGLGLDALDTKTKCFRKETQITVSNDARPKFPRPKYTTVPNPR